MRISIFGLDYVGCVSAACLAEDGDEVVGVDMNKDKVDIINGGRSPIVERDINKIIKRLVTAKKLVAVTDGREAVSDSPASMICVSTPGNGNGSLDLSHVKKVCAQIGASLREKDDYHAVVVRNTMLPGSVEGKITPDLESFWKESRS